MGDGFPRFKAAAVQMAAVWLDREATTEKVCRLLEQAAAQGAELVVFPEVIIPGTPHWIWREPENSAYFVELFRNSVDIPGDTTRRLCEAAAKAGAYAVVGVHERQGKALYNAMLFISREGRLLGSRRKLVGTMAEKTIWGQGGGDGLQVFPTELGRLGGLICGENLDNLARHALAIQGEEVHAAIYVAGAARRGPGWNRGVEVAAVYHAITTQCYVICAQAVASPEEIKAFGLLGPGGWSAIVAPDGQIIAGPLVGEEGVVLAQLDLEQAIRYYPLRDRVGYHGRPDVFTFRVDRRPYSPLSPGEEPTPQESP